MLFGFTGASRTGKSTLAKTVAEELGIEYVASSVTECARRHGFDPVAPMSLVERLTLQTLLLEDHIAMLQTKGRPLFVDRTPIDFIGYLMAEFSMYSGLLTKGDNLRMADRYVDLCLETVRSHYDLIFVVSQLDAYEAAPDKPPENRAYQTHTQLIMEGAMLRLESEVSFVALTDTDFEFRRSTVHDIVVGRLNDLDRMRRTSAHIQ